MKINETKSDNVVILELVGRLDSTSLGQIENRLPDLIESGERNILLDFSGLDYINSAGLRVLILAGKQLKRTGGKIVLCSMQDYIKEVFDISGFSNYFSIIPSQQKALEAFQ